MDDYKNIGNLFGACGVFLAHMVDDARPRGFRPIHRNVSAGGVPTAPHSPTCWHFWCYSAAARRKAYSPVDATFCTEILTDALVI
jgi:hypothetical protein